MKISGQAIRRIFLNLELLFFSVIIFCLIAEIASRLSSPFLPDAPKDWRARVQARKDSIKLKPLGEASNYQGIVKLHPFFGYLLERNAGGVDNFGFGTPYSLGILNGHYCVKPCSQHFDLVIGIFGGSFAQHVGNETSGYIESQLAQSFPGKKIAVINFAMFGHALPQSLYIFTMFRELLNGAVFIDGLNEVWNPVLNNASGVPPEYAKIVHWRYKLSRNDLPDEKIWLLARLSLQQRIMSSFTRFTLLPLAERSFALHLLWQRMNRFNVATVTQASASLDASIDDSTKFFSLSDYTIQKFAVERWAADHRLIEDMSKAKGICAVHLIQPSPYFEGGRIRSSGERAVIEHDRKMIEPFVETGYPLLLDRVHRMSNRFPAMRLRDLSAIFDTSPAPTWNDGAHANHSGNLIVADQIINELRTCLNH